LGNSTKIHALNETADSNITAETIGTERGINVAPMALTTRVDTTSESDVIYIGSASPGSATSEAVWQIIKITISSGDVSIIYANGEKNFNNIWDSRTGLSYS
jgi:hypothetical protein